LGLGIGLNTAIFSVVHGVLLKPLDYDDSHELVYVQASLSNDQIEHASHSGGDFRDIQDWVPALKDVAAVGRIRQNLTGLEPPRRVAVGWASSNLFRVLGVEAAIGRGFEPHDPPGTAVLGHALWATAFGSDPAVIGGSVLLDGHPYTVVGVLPEGFRLHLPGLTDDIEAWKVPDDWWQNGDAWGAQGPEFALFRVIGRLAPGANMTEAQTQLEALAGDLRRRFPEHDRAGLRLAATRLLDNVVQDVRPTLLMLLGAVALVLLIACANVMNLLLARTRTRSREIALRMALGSGRSRVVRLLLAESLALALLGGAAGVALAYGGIEVLDALAPAGLPRSDDVTLAPGVLGFALAVSLLCTILFGLTPAVVAARATPGRGLRDGRTSTPGRLRLGGALVVVQIATSLVLLTGAGLLAASLIQLHQVEPGFETDDLLTFSVSLPGTQYGWPDEADRFFRELEDRVEGLPGVRSAGVVWPMPFAGRSWSGLFTAGDVGEEARSYADYRLATPTYFETVGARILDGRTFLPDDRREVVLVSRALAERAWPGRSALGEVVGANPWGGGMVEFEVIGVVNDVQYVDLREPAEPAVYFDSRGWAWTDWEVNFAVRTAGDPTTLIGPVRAELLAMDANVPLDDPRPMADLVADQLATNRFALTLIGMFAAVAGLLAIVGLYGVLSYTVGQRLREIGIRMALGSERAGILRLVLGRGMRLTVTGVALGVVAALLMTRLLTSYLFGVSSTDPLTFTVVAAVFLSAAALASYLPARKATGLDPVTVLRAE
jgi:predicted permease